MLGVTMPSQHHQNHATPRLHCAELYPYCVLLICTMPLLRYATPMRFVTPQDDAVARYYWTLPLLDSITRYFALAGLRCVLPRHRRALPCQCRGFPNQAQPPLLDTHPHLTPA